jgi:hypothetical protein
MGSILRRVHTTTILMLLCTGCGGSPTAPASTDLSFDRIDTQRFFNVGGRAFPVETMLTVTDQGTWTDVWGRLTASSMPPAPLPSVDFTRSSVAVAALGARGESCCNIDITAVRRQASTIVVDVTEVTFTGCDFEQALIGPVVMVTLPVPNAAPTFNVTRVTRHC